MASPVEVRRAPAGDRLTISWDDGRETALSAAALRRECPCAACRDEFTGQRRLDPNGVPDEVRVERIEPIGRYAIGLRFSDGHASGIYSWEMLRGLG